eukprot:TRINITY_DN756_c0_g1_i1.p1 TRINITY_DN756_c0_g1~~TRINITY_DN756_c0_g1_i1.p1  ORF type:complete len:239 (-),score=62.49 TRINITY_DN756_c0_g1_i1:916-1632(-)
MATATVADEPDQRLICGTCLIRKPLRSKHCRECGACVARFDHHCGWINADIGIANQVPFLAFVTLHLALVALWLALSVVAWRREIPNDSAWDVLSALFGRAYLPTLLLGAVAALALLTLLTVAVFTWRGALSNATTNERLHWSRYPWTAVSHETPAAVAFNWYDRGGALLNLAEFLACGKGKRPDYHTTYELPELPPRRREAMQVIQRAERQAHRPMMPNLGLKKLLAKKQGCKKKGS